MAIRKAVIETVVLFDDEITPREFIEKGDLADIEHEINGGDCLGLSKVKSIELVKPEALHDEQLALGNDGSFFPADEEGPTP